MNNFKEKNEILQKEIKILIKQIDLMAEDLKTPIHSKEWIKKYYEEKSKNI